MLTKEQQCQAINLAMQIETGTANYDEILKQFENYPNLALNLVTFWQDFDDMTRNAIKTLVNYKCVKHLNKCWELN